MTSMEEIVRDSTDIAHKPRRLNRLDSCCRRWNRIVVAVVALLVAFDGWSAVQQLKLTHVFSNGVRKTMAVLQQPAANNGSTGVTATNYAVFYHVFVNPDLVNLSLGVVEEQLVLWKNSSLADAPLYYGLIMGNANATKQMSMPCPMGSTCQQIYQQTEGWEVDTLQKLFEYCRVNTTHTVAYIHSKGSFHPNEDNDRLRKVLTRAVFSDECRAGMDSRRCNVCSARFSPMPHWHTPGNMWIAKCSYVANLIAPQHFEAAVRRLVTTFAQEIKRSPPEPAVGMGRFAAEHWIHTHPRVQPCGTLRTSGIPRLATVPVLALTPWLFRCSHPDVVTDPRLTWGYTQFNASGSLELQAAPRYPLSHYRGSLSKGYPFSTWAYRLYELKQLYNETPANESFVWISYSQPY